MFPRLKLNRRRRDPGTTRKKKKAQLHLVLANDLAALLTVYLFVNTDNVKRLRLIVELHT